MAQPFRPMGWWWMNRSSSGLDPQAAMGWGLAIWGSLLKFLAVESKREATGIAALLSYPPEPCWLCLVFWNLTSSFRNAFVRPVLAATANVNSDEHLILLHFVVKWKWRSEWNEWLCCIDWWFRPHYLYVQEGERCLFMKGQPPSWMAPSWCL